MRRAIALLRGVRTLTAVAAIWSLPHAAWAQACPSPNVNDVINDPRVQEGLDQAWADSMEGTENEHEEGGWVMQCRNENTITHEVSYFTWVVRWRPGTVDSSAPYAPARQDATCRTVATFHTHPGPASSDPNHDEYDNERPSGDDYLTAASDGLPGIIRFGSGDDTTDFTYNYGSVGDEPREPGWVCPQKGPAAHSWGDPHLMTFDGLSYDFMGLGDFVLARAARDFEIQARMEPVQGSTSASVTTGLAVRDGQHKVEWRVGSNPPLIDGVAQPLGPGTAVALRNSGLLRRTADGYAYLSGSGDRLLVYPMASTIDYTLRLAERRRGTMQGLFGDADGDTANDLRSADGQVVTRQPPDYQQPLYRVFAASWRPAPGAKLFTTPFATAGNADPQTFPSVPEISGSARASALAACTAAGVTDTDLLETCVFDFAITGDRAFIDSAARVERDIRAHSLVASDGPLAVDQELMGRLEGAVRRVTYTLALPAGTFLFDGRGSPKTRWELLDTSGRNWLAGEEFMWEVARRQTLPAGRYRLVVSLVPDASAGRFRLRVRRPADPEILSLAPGTSVEGTIATPGQMRTYRLQLEPGTYDFSPERRGDLSWSLVASGGIELFDANQSRFMERASGITITAPGLFELSVRGEYWTGTGSYRLTVERRP